MSSTDERVVKMTFDNERFEKNAKETMSTLDKLKEALNFKDTEKSFDAITQASNKVDVSNVTNSARTIKAEFSTMQVVAYTAIGNITNRLMNFAHGVVAGTFSSVVQGGINRAFKVEKAKFNIQGLGKDWTKISNDISEAVQGTAYGFDEAAAAAASLAASDVLSTGDANSPMLKGLKAIAGAAAMTGSSFSDISNIFTTVAGNGRILSQQLNQFSARGLNAAATLRDYINAHEDIKKKLIDAGMLSTQAKKVKEFAGNLKLTEGNIRTLVSASVVDFKTFSDAMSDAFGDQAKKADKTFSGVFANVKAALARIGQSFVQPLIANNDMDTMLEYVNTPLRRSMDDAKKFWAETSKDRHKFFKDLKQSEQFAGKSNSELRKEWAKNPIEFQKMVNTIKGHEKDLPGFINNMMNTQQQVFIGNMKQTKQYANTSDKELKKMYNTYKGFQNNLVGVLQGVKRIFLAVEKDIKGSKFLENFLKTADRGCKILILALNTLAAAFTKVTVKGKEISGLEIFGNRKKAHILSFERLLKKLQGALGLLDDDFNNLKDTVNGILDIFKLAWHIITEFVKALIPAKENFKGMGSSILEVTGFIGRALTKFSEFVENSGAITIAANAIRKGISLLIMPFRLAINFIGGFFKVIRTGDNPLKKFLTSIKKLWTTIKASFTTFIKTGKEVLKTFFEPFIENGKNVISNGGMLSGVLKVLAGVAITLANAISTAGKTVYDFITKFITIDQVKEAGEKFYDFVTNKFIPAIKSAFNWCKKFASGSFGKIGKTFKSIWDKISGSKIFDFSTLFSGTDKVSASTNGVIDNLKTSFSNFNLKDVILEKLDEIKNIDFSKFVENFKNGISNFLDFLSEAKVKIGEGIQNLRSALNDKAVDFKSFGKKIESGFKTTFEVVADLGPAVILAIGKLFTSMVDTMKECLPKPQVIGVFIGDFIAGIVENIVSLIPWAVETIGFTLRTIASHMPDILKSLAVQLREALDRALFEPIKVGTGEYQREIPPLFDIITDTIKVALGKVGEEIKDYTLDDFLNVLKKIVSIDLIKELAGLVKANKGLVKDFSKMLEDFLGGIEKSYSKYLKDEGKADKFEKFGLMIRNLAISIGILAAVLIVLGTVPIDTLKQGAIALAGLISAIVAMGASIAAIDKYLAAGNLAEISKGMAQLTGALAALGTVVIVMSFTDQDKLRESIAILAVIMAEIGAFVYAVNKIAPDANTLIATGTAIAEISGAIGGLTASIIFLGMMPKKQLEQGLKALGGVLAALTATMIIVKKFVGDSKGLSVKSIVGVLPIIVMLGSIMAALYVIKKYELDPSQLKWIDVTLLVLAGIMVLFTKVEINIAAAAKAALAIAAFVDILVINLGLIIAAISGLAKIPGIKEFVQGGGELLKEVGHMLSQVVVGFMEGVAEAMNALNKVDVPKDKIETVSKIGEVLKNLAKVQAIITKNGGLMTFFAGDQPFTKFGNGVKNLFVSFKDVGKEAGKVPNIDKIKQITEVAKALSEMVAAIKDPKALGEVLNLVGENKLTKLGKELIKFADDAKTATGKFDNIDTSGMKEAADDIASSVKSIAKALPKEGLKSTGTDAVDDIKSGVKGGGTKIAKTLSSELSSAVNSISTDRFKTKGEAFIKSFISGMEAKRKDIKDKANSLAKASGNAMDSQEAKNNAKEAGKNVLEGFKNGIDNGALRSQINSIAKSVGKKAVDKIKEGAEESSPSASADKAGRFIDIGLVNGMVKLVSNVAAAGKRVGKTAITGLQSALSDVGSLIDTDVNEPVIRPVLDLSNIKMGVNSIGHIFDKNRYALSVAASMPNSKLGNKNVVINNNITVDGAEDPAGFADELIRELEIQARTE